MKCALSHFISVVDLSSSLELSLWILLDINGGGIERGCQIMTKMGSTMEKMRKFFSRFFDQLMLKPEALLFVKGPLDGR